MGQTVYHGVAKNVYVAKEALIGLGSRLASSLGAGGSIRTGNAEGKSRGTTRKCQRIRVQEKDRHIEREREKTFETLRAIFLSL